MKTLLRTILVFSCLLYSSAAGYLYLYQDQFLYHPTAVREPVNATDFTVVQKSGVLRGWVVNPGHKQGLLYFGGNGEAVERNVDTFKKVFDHYTIYLVNYRGYGRSDGKPSEKALLSDALALYDQVADQHESLSVIGKSLGSGVASYLASHRQVSRLVLVTPYDSIERIAQQRFWMMPISIMLDDKYRAYQWVKDLTAQTLVVMSEFDSTVPRQHSLNLIAAFGQRQPQQYVVKNAQHNTISRFSDYYRQLKLFLQ